MLNLESVSTKIFGRYAEMRCKREMDLDLFFGLVELILDSSSSGRYFRNSVSCFSSFSGFSNIKTKSFGVDVEIISFEEDLLLKLYCLYCK